MCVNTYIRRATVRINGRGPRTATQDAARPGSGRGRHAESARDRRGPEPAVGNVVRPVRAHLQRATTCCASCADRPTASPAGRSAQRMVNPSPDVTRLIDRLARRGLVRRMRARSDRRLSLTRITPKGVALLERAGGGERRTARAARVPAVRGRVAAAERAVRAGLRRRRRERRSGHICVVTHML